MPAQMSRGSFPQDETGRGVAPTFVRAVDASGNDASGVAYQILGVPGGVGETLAATSGTSPVTVQRGSYLWDAQFTGASLQLQAQAADGVTWRTVSTLNASGTQTGFISFGLGTKVRIYNPNATSVTNAWSSVS